MTKAVTTIGSYFYRNAFAEWKRQDGPRFHNRASFGDQLRQVFRGQRRGKLMTALFGRNDRIQVNGKSRFLVSGHAAAFDPAAYASLRTGYRPPPATARPGPVPATPMTASGKSSTLSDVREFGPGILEAKLQTRITRWYATSAQAQAGAPISARIEAAQERHQLVQCIDDGLDALHRHDQAAIGTQAHPDDKATVGGDQIMEARRDHARAALAVVLPGCDNLREADQLGAMRTITSVTKLTQRLAAMRSTAVEDGRSTQEAAAKRPACEGLTTLLATLADHGRIREWSTSADPVLRAWALEGLRDLVDTVLASIDSEDRDTALNSLLCRNAPLDELVKELRVWSTQKKLLAQAAAQLGPSAPSPQDKAAHAKEAQKGVEQEIAIAQAKHRLMRALDLAGIPRPVNSLASMRIDPVMADALRERLGDQAGEVGLAIVALRLLERKLAPEVDEKGAPPPTDDLGNLTPAEQQLLKNSDEQTLIALTQRGLVSADKAAAALDRINQALQGVTRFLTPTRFADLDAPIFQQVKDDEAANQLGDLLLRSITNDMSLSLAQARDKTGREALDRQMAQTWAKQTAAIGALSTQPVPSELDKLLPDPQRGRRSGDAFDWNLLTEGRKQSTARLWDQGAASLNSAQGRLVGASQALDQQQQARLAAVEHLQRAVADDRLALNPERPAGYNTCLRLKQAFELLDEPHLTPGQSQQLDALCARLKGLDPRRLDTPWSSRTQVTPDTLRRALRENEQLRKDVEAVIHIRRADEGLIRSTEQALGDMEKLLVRRHRKLGSAAPLLRDMVRAAILMQRGDKTALLDFQPHAHAREIEATLQRWGVPVDELRPEIQRALGESIGPDELNLWREQIHETGLYREKFLAEHERRVQEEARKTAQHTPVSPLVREALMDGIDRLGLGGRMKIGMGYKVDLQTGPIPVEPTLVNTVSGKAAATSLNRMDISYGPSGFELVLGGSFDLKAGSEWSARIPGASLAGLSVGAGLGAEGSYARSKVIVLRFPRDTGRAALKEVVARLATHGQLRLQDLAKAKTVNALVEHKLGGKAQGQAKATWQPLDPLALGDNGIKFSLGVKATATVAGQTQWSVDEGTELLVRKTEKEFSAELGASANLALGAALTERYKLPLDVAELGHARTVNYKFKTLEVRTAYGQVSPSTEQQVQSFAPKFMGLKVAQAMGGAPFQELLRLLDQKDRESARAIRELLRSANTNEMISIASSIDEQLLKDIEANRYDEAEVRRLLDAPESYLIERITLTGTREATPTVAILNLGLLKVSCYAEDKGEFITDIYPRRELAREARNRVLGIHDEPVETQEQMQDGEPAPATTPGSTDRKVAVEDRPADEKDNKVVGLRLQPAEVELTELRPPTLPQ